MSATEKELRVMVVSVESSWLTPERSCCCIFAGVADKCSAAVLVSLVRLKARPAFFRDVRVALTFQRARLRAVADTIPREAVRAQETAKCEGIKQKREGGRCA